MYILSIFPHDLINFPVFLERTATTIAEEARKDSGTRTESPKLGACQQWNP